MKQECAAPFAQQNLNGVAQSQFPKETVTCLHWYGGCSMIVENERSVRSWSAGSGLR